MSRAKGAAYEEVACEWLVDKGYEILARNWTKKGGEIDIIAKKDGVIRFVEVKSGEGFDPIHAFTKQKIGRVARTAERWIQNSDIKLPYCIDALVIRDGEVELIENITFWYRR